MYVIFKMTHPERKVFHLLIYSQNACTIAEVWGQRLNPDLPPEWQIANYLSHHHDASRGMHLQETRRSLRDSLMCSTDIPN